MDELSAKLSELLSSPDAADRLREAAEALLGGQSATATQPAASDTVPAISNIDMAAVARLISAFNSPENDDRTALLVALRPHLSPERRERVDKALKLLKLARLLPLIRAEGLLEL